MLDREYIFRGESKTGSGDICLYGGEKIMDLFLNQPQANQVSNAVKGGLRAARAGGLTGPTLRRPRLGAHGGAKGFQGISRL